MTSLPLPIADDDFAVGYAGTSLSHLLSVTADDSDLGPAARSVVERLGGHVDSIRSARIATTMCHQIRLGGLTPGAARTAASHVAELPGVAYTQVEHLLRFTA